MFRVSGFGSEIPCARKIACSQRDWAILLSLCEHRICVSNFGCKTIGVGLGIPQDVIAGPSFQHPSGLTGPFTRIVITVQSFELASGRSCPEVWTIQFPLNFMVEGVGYGADGSRFRV